MRLKTYSLCHLDNDIRYIYHVRSRRPKDDESNRLKVVAMGNRSAAVYFGT